MCFVTAVALSDFTSLYVRYAEPRGGGGGYVCEDSETPQADNGSESSDPTHICFLRTHEGQQDGHIVKKKEGCFATLTSLYCCTRYLNGVKRVPLWKDI